MPAQPLISLGPDATPEQVKEIVIRDGAVIVKNLISDEKADAVVAECQPYVDATPQGRDAFTGFKTTRTGALVARSPQCHDLILNKTVLGGCDAFLEPYCERYQLHLTQIIAFSRARKNNTCIAIALPGADMLNRWNRSSTRFGP